MLSKTSKHKGGNRPRIYTVTAIGSQGKVSCYSYTFRQRPHPDQMLHFLECGMYKDLYPLRNWRQTLRFRDLFSTQGGFVLVVSAT